MSAAYAYGGLAALQLVGGYYASENIKATADLNNDIADMNAEFAELDAYDAEIDGYSEVARYQSVIDSTLGTQRANLAAADVDLNYGTAATIEEETRFIAEVNKMEILAQAEAQSLGYQREARDYRLKGFLDSAQAAGRASSARFGAVTSAANTGLTGYRRTR